MTAIHRKSPRTARILPSVLAALFVFLPVTGHALGLGKLKVHSSLNQPLDAEIDFTSLTETELKGLTVGLASRADFAAAGVERTVFLAQIKFTVNRRADGRYALQFSTPAPIEEPFLHLLLQIDWSGGRLVREYTALIDPPYQIPAKAPAVEPPRVAASATDPARAASAVTEEPPYTPPASGDAALASDGWPLESGEAPPDKPITTQTTAKGRIGPAPSWANTASHTIRRGETLWSIVKKVRGDPQVSIEQAALAIYRQNRDAFYGDNLNNVRAGKILRLPAREDVAALSREQARGAFQAQFDAWQEHKLRLAQVKRTVAVDDSGDGGGKTAAGEPAEAEAKPAVDRKPATGAPATKPATPAAKGQRADELLKIVRSNLQGEKGADGRTTTEPVKRGEREQVALAERAETLEESLVSKQIEQKELSDKIGQVRAQLKRESRLIELESPALAPKPEAPKPPAPVAEPAKAEPPPAVAPPKTEAPKAEAPKPETKPKADTPQPAPKKGLPPPPSAEKGVLDTLFGVLGDLLLPIVLGVVLLASALLGFVYMRRRHKAAAEFEESILASQAVTMDDATTRDAAGKASTTARESSILSDISQGNPANVHADEVDPVAEAEVYLAYGRDETAEELLRDAVIKHPQRQELKIKLLEIYFHRKDVKAFETLAEEVYAAVGGKGGKLWEKIEDMGGKLSPANPMFRGTASAAATRGHAGQGAEDIKATPAVAAATTGGAQTEVVSPPLAPESALDFDLGTSAVTTETKRAEPSFDLDFDLDRTKSPAPKAAEPAPSVAKSAATGLDTGLEPLDLGAPADNLIDFDFGKSGAGPGVTAPPPGKSAGTAASTGDKFSLDLGMDIVAAEPAPAEAAAAPAGAAQQQRWDEAATKLDLARAYIDMGDAEGARSILEEVTAEGNPEQKKQAQDLVAQIR